MRHIVLLLLCLTLIGCGTAPSKQQDAQQYAEETTAKRQGINALRYGQSIETVHRHLSESYIPWADYKSGENTYFIDSFRVPHAKEYNEFFALYKNKKLIAVTPIKKTDAIHPRIIKAYCFSLFDNEGICERGLSDTYWSGFIKQLQTNKVALGNNTLVKSEQDIADEIAQASTEQQKSFTYSDAGELAVVATLAPLTLGGATAAAMTLPVGVPYMIINDKATNQRAANTPDALQKMRNTPLGATFESTGQKSNKPPILQEIETDMKYSVALVYKNNRTFLRMYYDELK